MTETPFAYKWLDLNKLVSQSFKLTEKQQFILSFNRKQRTSSHVFNDHYHWAKQVWVSLTNKFPTLALPNPSLQGEQGKAWKHNPLKGFICVSQSRLRVLKLTEGLSSSASLPFIPSVPSQWPHGLRRPLTLNAGTPWCISEQN